jgi:ABC-type Fe3+/spermidine/putrescine transport system ATPase subunit
VDGNWSRRRLSREAANRMARAKHLKTASILWWLEAPVQHLDVKVRTGVIDEAAEEILEEFDGQVAHQTRFHQSL